MMQSSSIYERLDPSSKQIRLVQLTSRKASRSEEIRCKIQTFDLESSPRYKALSYAWGTSDRQQRILLNGRNILIRRNLYDFLKVFRQRRDRGLIWIDQLCIDQFSVKEKNHQVGMMEQIYNYASETLIWLGLDPNSGLAFAAVHRCACDENNPEEYKSKWSSLVTQAEKQAVRAMLSEPYWTRHWVAQEIWFSSDHTITLVYGDHALAFHELICLVLSLGATFLRSSPAIELLELYNESSRRSIICVWGDWTSFASTSSCQDSKDKVFGLQKMFEPELQIAVDYALSVKDVYMAMVARWYQEFSQNRMSANEWELVLSGCYFLADGMGLVQSNDEIQDKIWEILEHLRIEPGAKEEETRSDITWEEFGLVLQQHLLISMVSAEVYVSQ